MPITLTDEMLEVLQGLDKDAARGFLRGIQMAQESETVRPHQKSMPTDTTAPAPNPIPTTVVVGTHKSSAHNRGAQAELLRLLFTGPAGYIQLQDSSRYPRQVVVRAISQLRRQGDLRMLKTNTGQEVWELTPQGRSVAAHYVQNPGLKVLNRQHLEKAKSG